MKFCEANWPFNLSVTRISRKKNKIKERVKIEGLREIKRGEEKIYL